MIKSTDIFVHINFFFIIFCTQVYERRTEWKRKRSKYKEKERKKMWFGETKKILLLVTYRKKATPRLEINFIMILAVVLLINNIGLFVLETIGYHACHSGKCINIFILRK